jgi:Family of unknown function (DUF6152)
MGGFRAAYVGGMLAGILTGASSLPVQAHHSFAMFDHAKTVTLKGTVESFSWANPHSHITVKVPSGAAGEAAAGTWDVEGASTNIMFRQGWNRMSIKPGDKITVVGFPAKDGTQGVALIYVITPTGEKLWQDVNRPSIAPQS